jgi:hypothetical protein
MAGKRVIWHVGFGRLLRRRGSPAFEVREEVPLSEEPPRMDYLLLRKHLEQDPPGAEDAAQTLRRLWPLLPLVSVVEYKSPGRSYRTGDLDRLLAYVHSYHADERTRPPSRRALCAVLAVPARTRTLDAEVEGLGLSWHDLGAGYWRALGTLYTLYVVELRVVARMEGDDLLQFLGTGDPTTPAARWFWTELVGSQEAGMSIQDTEGYDEFIEKILSSMPAEQVLSHYAPEQRLAGLAPEQRLAGLAPEQRLAGLDHDHEALALPVHLLRLLPESYIASLSAEVQAEVRRRLQRGD